MAVQKPHHKGKSLSNASTILTEDLITCNAQDSKSILSGHFRTSAATSPPTLANESEQVEIWMEKEELKTMNIERESGLLLDPLADSSTSSLSHLLFPSQTVVRPSTVRGRIFAPIHSPQDTSQDSSSLMQSFLALAHQKTDRENCDRSTKDEAEIQFPMSPIEAIKKCRQNLTEFEQGEILDFPQVYFVGHSSSKKIHVSSALSNYGFDDEKGNYKLFSGDHIAYRFEILSFIGCGSFGQVCKCFDHKHRELVALKVIKNKKRFRQQGAIEVKVLDLLRTKDPDDLKGVVKMKASFQFRRHICITLELLECSLSEFLKMNKFKGVSQNLVRRFGLQLVLVLQYMKSLSIIHCDLKPENILLKHPSKSAIKVIDFGSACLESERVYTYIQSRYYRAPEIILGMPYSSAIDMWSFGCVLTELYLGTPPFQGENEQDQLLCMMEVLGPPPKEVLQLSSRKRLFFDGNSPRIPANSRGKKRIPASKTLQSLLKGASPLFVDFVRQCFSWNPATRLTPEAALSHGWIQEGIVKMQQATLAQGKKESADRRRVAKKEV